MFSFFPHIEFGGNYELLSNPNKTNTKSIVCISHELVIANIYILKISYLFTDAVNIGHNQGPPNDDFPLSRTSPRVASNSGHETGRCQILLGTGKKKEELGSVTALNTTKIK
jgi:hypothetical protein